MFYLLKKKEKKYCLVPAKGTFHLSTDFCITVQAPNTLFYFNHQGQNRISIQPKRVFFQHFETITIIYDTG